jgi:ketosteroid isomerase-like protein
MPQLPPPAALEPATVDALTAVRAWGEAFNERDGDRLLALAAPDVQIESPRGPARGHAALRRMLELQTYGVAQRIHPVRYFALGTTVAIEARIEFRWVESGELADSADGVAVVEVRDGRVASIRPTPDLATAHRAAGWPPRSGGSSGA